VPIFIDRGAPVIERPLPNVELIDLAPGLWIWRLCTPPGIRTWTGSRW
jgi:hypothetical protein